MLQDWPAEKRESLYAQTNLGRVGNGEFLSVSEMKDTDGELCVAEEIGRTILFLASEAGGYCSGSTLKVDGGWSKWC
jgi:NAD(P)-dependent dehydrogenase (short-subunit alcohol dehydrogenase family)